MVECTCFGLNRMGEVPSGYFRFRRPPCRPCLRAILPPPFRLPCSLGDSFFPVTDDLPCAQASAISGCLAHKYLRWFSDLKGNYRPPALLRPRDRCFLLMPRLCPPMPLPFTRPATTRLCCVVPRIPIFGFAIYFLLGERRTPPRLPDRLLPRPVLKIRELKAEAAITSSCLSYDGDHPYV